MSPTPQVQPIDIHTHDGVADSWLYQPDGVGPWPGVILLPDIKGVRPVFRQMAQQLAALGYVVLLPNFYYRALKAEQIDPKASFREEAGKAYLTRLRSTLTPAGLRGDHAAYLQTLARHASVAGERVAVVGYCMSGAYALHAAADFPEQVVAAASFHGGGLAADTPDSPHHRVGDIRAQLYLGYASNDGSMPGDRITVLEDALKTAGVRYRSEVYAAGHGYAVSDNPSYDAAAAAQHWQRLEALLGETLGPNAS